MKVDTDVIVMPVLAEIVPEFEILPVKVDTNAIAMPESAAAMVAELVMPPEALVPNCVIPIKEIPRPAALIVPELTMPPAKMRDLEYLNAGGAGGYRAGVRDPPVKVAVATLRSWTWMPSAWTAVIVPALVIPPRKVDTSATRMPLYETPRSGRYW